MSERSEQVEPFLGGAIFPPYGDVLYPRSDPVASDFLPADVWQAAQIPVGVRLEVAGTARTIEIGYKTATGNLGYRGDGAGCTFVAYRAGQKVAEEEAVLGEGVVRLSIPGDNKRHATIYLPEGMRPSIHYVVGVDGTIEPAPMQPRWIAYGDAIAQGWLASTPALSWPSVVARKIGLDVCNLGYAGSARAETNTASMIAHTPADVISVSYGLNCWERIPHSVGLMAESIKAFIGIIRSGHPTTPIIVMSPVVYPEAENTPNVLGATMSDLRMSMDAAVRECMAAGDLNIRLISGIQVLGEEDLVDGMYPGDEGHKRIAAAVGKHLSQLQPEIVKIAGERWNAQPGQPASDVALSAAPAGAVSPGLSISGGYAAVGQYTLPQAQPGVPVDSGIPAPGDIGISGSVSASSNEVPPLEQWAEEQSSLNETNQAGEAAVPPPAYQVVAHYNPGSGYGPS